jgi:hypothetical protein
MGAIPVVVFKLAPGRGLEIGPRQLVVDVQDFPFLGDNGFHGKPGGRQINQVDLIVGKVEALRQSMSQ